MFGSPKYRQESRIRKEAPVAVDFLNERTRVSMRMSDEAFGYLPEITSEERETEQERFRTLLGRWQQKGEHEVEVHIEAIVEFEPRELRYLDERHGEVVVDTREIKNLVTNLQATYPEYRQYMLLGELHTHPVLQNELDSHQRSWHFSSGDQEAWINEYKNGVLSNDCPFIFGVAGAMENGKTGYSFYRVVREGKEYSVIHVPWPA